MLAPSPASRSSPHAVHWRLSDFVPSGTIASVSESRYRTDNPKASGLTQPVLTFAPHATLSTIDDATVDSRHPTLVEFLLSAALFGRVIVDIADTLMILAAIVGPLTTATVFRATTAIGELAAFGIEVLATVGFTASIIIALPSSIDFSAHLVLGAFVITTFDGPPAAIRVGSATGIERIAVYRFTTAGSWLRYVIALVLVISRFVAYAAIRSRAISTIDLSLFSTAVLNVDRPTKDLVAFTIILIVAGVANAPPLGVAPLRLLVVVTITAIFKITTPIGHGSALKVVLRAHTRLAIIARVVGILSNVSSSFGRLRIGWIA